MRKSVSNRQEKVESRLSVKERLSHHENPEERTTHSNYGLKHTKQQVDNKPYPLLITNFQVQDERDVNIHRASADRTKLNKQKDLEEEFDRLQTKLKRNMSHERTQAEGHSVSYPKRQERIEHHKSQNDHSALKKYIPKPSKNAGQGPDAASREDLKSYIKKEHSNHVILI